MTTVTVNITKEVLFKTQMCGKSEESISSVGMNCAIGYAINKLLPFSWVDSNNIAVYKNMECLNSDDIAVQPMCRIMLPFKAQVFISKFDKLTSEERLVQPEFSFDIQVPDAALENIDISDIFAKSKTLQLHK